MSFFLLGLAPLFFVGLAIYSAFPAPRWRAGIQLCCVMLGPLVLLSLYLVAQYRTWRWDLLPYGSWVPHILAAAIFVVALGVILYRSSITVGSKAIVGLVAIVCWVVMWFFTALGTSCAMGDCL